MLCLGGTQTGNREGENLKLLLKPGSDKGRAEARMRSCPSSWRTQAGPHIAPHVPAGDELEDGEHQARCGNLTTVGARERERRGVREGKESEREFLLPLPSVAFILLVTVRGLRAARARARGPGRGAPFRGGSRGPRAPRG